MTWHTDKLNDFPCCFLNSGFSKFHDECLLNASCHNSPNEHQTTSDRCYVTSSLKVILCSSLHSCYLVGSAMLIPCFINETISEGYSVINFPLYQ
ncbi:hypothetical protein AHF37_12659 [Paragonimus kellicotti]|nr:hypothetical protein AHF37_12659 [Paragonimus kellicotti]